MKKLHEYETPISKEASFARWTNHAGIQCKTETDSVPVVVARDLERKLALAMDMLSKLTVAGIAEHEMREVAHTGVYIGGGLFREAVETLKALREIENADPQG